MQHKGDTVYSDRNHFIVSDKGGFKAGIEKPALNQIKNKELIRGKPK